MSDLDDDRADGEGLRELQRQAPPDAGTHAVHHSVGAGSARRWPAEHVWLARRFG